MDCVIRFFGNNFIPMIGVLYLFAKLIIRNMIHRLIIKEGSKVIDNWQIVAWFGVDVAVLSASISIAANVPSLKQYNYNETAVWYILMVFCLFCSALTYGIFIKKRKSMKNISPLKDYKIFIWLLFCILSGVLFFVPTLSALIKIG